MPGSVTDSEANTCESLPTAPAYNPDTSDGETPADADLRRVVDVWPGLPLAVRAGILAIVNAVSEL